MRENQGVRLLGTAVELVPYGPEFVPRYHEWMQDEHILAMTASEPLSLEEEFAMQRSWAEDANKCTFIVLTTEGRGDEGGGELARMAGDVNLFLNDRDDPRRAEIEVMIAEPRLRRRGMAREALALMMRFGRERLGLRRFYAKIHRSNEASLALFRSLGFAEVNYVAAFEEFEFNLDVTD